MTTPEALAEIMKAERHYDLATGAICGTTSKILGCNTCAVLAHLGEGREQHVCTKCGYVTVDQSVEHVIAAQAAAHAEDVRKIQVRMVKLEELLRKADRLIPVGGSMKTPNIWWHEDYDALLAKVDGR